MRSASGLGICFIPFPIAWAMPRPRMADTRCLRMGNPGALTLVPGSLPLVPAPGPLVK